MTLKPLHLTLAAALAATALAGCNRDANRDHAGELPPATAPAATSPMTPPDTGMPPATRAPETAVNVTSVTLGTRAGADRSISNPTTTFAAGDPVVVSVRTDGAASNVELGARLVYQDGQVAGEERQTLNTTGSETTNITFNNANDWPAGTYTVEVTVDGARADSTSFTVR
ncbi:hypothetical protein LY625_07050 [Lysobacter sp. GX 14042]|uniref:hypothetical protein n=1 Tax=Lysobacter sp. GX 14042 TaxID=2907155 RepID=UPI001F46591D|nr:hypothetical protein [Lysobacter sp. GX 14042]MCE7032380.1 hypothetical protein [Lysobacter sp. GX 14042]